MSSAASIFNVSVSSRRVAARRSLAALHIVEDGICQLVQAFALWTHTSRPFEITCAAGRSRFECTRQGATLYPSHNLGILPVSRSHSMRGSAQQK